MVTEQTPSGDSANQLPKEDEGIEDITSTNQPQEGAGEQAEAGAADQTQGQSPEQRTFSAEEFSKYQSKTDKQISDLTSQLQEERGTREKAEEQARMSCFDNEVAVFQEQEKQKAITQYGMDENQADAYGRQQADMMKNLYLKDMAAKSTQQQLAEQSKVNEELSGKALVSEVANKYNIPANDLQALGITNAEALDKMAQVIADNNRLKAPTAPPQQFDSNYADSAVAPTDAEGIVDRYNDGDPNVSWEQFVEAGKKLGMKF